MPMRVVEITDLREFTLEFVTNVGVQNMDPHNQDLSDGVNLGNSDATSGGGEYTYGQYFHNADFYLWWQPTQKNSSMGGSRTIQPAVYATDALCRDSEIGWYWPTTFQPNFNSIFGQTFHFGGTAKHRFVAGQPNLTSGAQAFYWFGDISGSPSGSPETYVPGWHSFFAATGDRDVVFADLWPLISSTFNGVNGGAADGNTAGYWNANTGANGNQDEYHALVFEGITDTTGGFPGETSASAGKFRGGNSHPLGLLLIRARNSNFLGDGPSNDVGTRWIWVDITTGLAIGVLGLPGVVNSHSNNTFHDESFDTRVFDWQGVQFVPDAGSTFDQPKGELHFFLAEDGRFEIPDQTIAVGSDPTFQSRVGRQYVTIIDFNPFNADTGSVRIHNRRRFLGSFDTPYEPIQDGGANLPKLGTTNNRRSPGTFYHPPSRSWVNIQNSWPSANNDDTDQPDIGASRIIRWARQTEVGLITHPVPTESVKENSTVELRMKVTDDFNGSIAGETINFRTNRQSTRDEQFDGTAQAGADYVVDQAVIDNDGSLQVYSGGGIDSGGTLLTVGVDYTVSSFATGTLSPVVNWPTDTISVRYRHRSSPVLPGFGTLINENAVSNADGVVRAFIELPDLLRGELVGLEADSELFS